MRARTIGVTVLGTLVLTATAASAAGLSWSTGQLGAASAAVPACVPALPTSTSPYVLDGAGLVTGVRVVVAARAGVCDSGSVTVSLRDAAGVVGTGSLSLPSSTACSGTLCTVPITSPAPGLEAVKATHVLQTGA